MTERDNLPQLPHHQLSPGDVLRWQCPNFPENVHRWRVRGVYLGGMGQESLIECESLTHTPGWSGPESNHRILFIPQELVRQCTIEDVGDKFGIPSARRLAR